MLNRRVRRFVRGEEAAAMVEFAIIAPLLFLLIFGIVDYGRFFFDYTNVTNAVREGARIAAIQDPVIVDSVRALVKSRVQDTRIDDATISVTEFNRGDYETVQVSVSGYPFEAVSFFIPIPNQLPLVQAEFRHELK